MKRSHGIAIIIAAALVSSATGASFGAAAGKGAGAQRAKAGEHMSERGRANTNAQWSADPERGWVRSEERHRLHEQKEFSEKQGKAQPKAKGKSTKAY